jgi:hypothetical protein
LHIAIVGTGRSGTTAFSKLFTDLPDSFFFYEPLFPEGPAVHHRPAAEVIHSNDDSEVERKLWTCDIFKAPQLRERVFWRYGIHYSPVIQKMAWSNATDAASFTEAQWSQLEQACRDAKTVVVKTIRVKDLGRLSAAMSVSSSESRKYRPRSRRVIFVLYRDVRAIIASQLRLRWYETSEIRKEATKVCSASLERFKYTRGLNNRPDHMGTQFELIKYEDWVANLAESSLDLFRRLGKFNETAVKKIIHKLQTEDSHHQHAGLNLTTYYNVTGAARWEDVLSPSDQKVVEEVCRSYLQVAGYL